MGIGKKQEEWDAHTDERYILIQKRDAVYCFKPVCCLQKNRETGCFVSQNIWIARNEIKMEMKIK